MPNIKDVMIVIIGIVALIALLGSMGVSLEEIEKTVKNITNWNGTDVNFLDVIINGDLTILGEFVNITVQDYNITNNATADYFIARTDIRIGEVSVCLEDGTNCKPVNINGTDAHFGHVNLTRLNASSIDVIYNATIDYINVTDILTLSSHKNEISLKDTGHWMLHIVDDVMVHHTNLSISASGGVVTIDINNEQYPGHNMAYIVNETKYRLIEGSTDTATLTVGTSVNPQTNYIYADKDEQLKASITPPTGEYAWAGIVEVHVVNGNDVNYSAIQDEVPVLYELVKSNYERAWYDGVIYESGIDITLDVAPHLSTTAGTLRFALTSVPYEARNVSNETKFVYVDDPDVPFTVYDNLLGISKYQSGESIGTNKYFKVMFYGLVEDNDNDYFYFSVQDKPTSECTSVSCADADVEHKMNYQFPTRYKRTGFRIMELVLKHGVGSNAPQVLSNGLLYRQLLDESIIVYGGTSSVALGLDEVVENNPNTDNNIFSTANITASWFLGYINSSNIRNTPLACPDGYYQTDYNGTHRTCVVDDSLKNGTDAHFANVNMTTLNVTNDFHFGTGNFTFNSTRGIHFCTDGTIIIGNIEEVNC